MTNGLGRSCAYTLFPMPTLLLGFVEYLISSYHVVQYLLFNRFQAHDSL